MIDNFVLALTHGLMLLAAWRLLFRPDLEDDKVPPPPPQEKADGWAKLRARVLKGTAEGA
jgi:hypothetical protein